MACALFSGDIVVWDLNKLIIVKKINNITYGKEFIKSIIFTDEN